MGAHLSSPRTEKVSSNGGDFKLDSTIFGSTSMQGWRISMEDAHLTLPHFLFSTQPARADAFKPALNADDGNKLGPGAPDALSAQNRADFAVLNKSEPNVVNNSQAGANNCSAAPASSHLSAGGLRGSIYGVFDGHGGNCVSRWVSENFSYIFMNELEALLLGAGAASGATASTAGSAAAPGSALHEPFHVADAGAPSTPESRLIGRALENSFLKLDEYLQKPEVDRQLHLISTNKRASGDNLFKVLLPEKITNRQHAIDIIQQLTGGYGIGYPVSAPESVEGAPIATLSDAAIDPSAGSDAPSKPDELNKYDSIPYYSSDGSTEPSDMDEINAELGLDDGNLMHSDSIDAPDPALDGSPDSAISVAEAVMDTPLDPLTAAHEPAAEAPEEPLNNELYAMGCGSTSVVAVVLEDPTPCLIVANAGDSRCVLSRNKVAVPLSVDHKPTDEPELSRIKNAGGYVINGRVDGNLNLSRSLGDLSFKLDGNLSSREQKIISFPDVKILPLTREDEFLVLACDGIWDCKSNQQVVDYVNYKFRLYMDEADRKAARPTEPKPERGLDRVESIFESSEPDRLLRSDSEGALERKVLERICEELCDMCLSSNPSESEGIGCDNMTIIIVKFNHQLYQKI